MASQDFTVEMVRPPRLRHPVRCMYDRYSSNNHPSASGSPRVSTPETPRSNTNMVSRTNSVCLVIGKYSIFLGASGPCSRTGVLYLSSVGTLLGLNAAPKIPRFANLTFVWGMAWSALTPILDSSSHSSSQPSVGSDTHSSMVGKCHCTRMYCMTCAFVDVIS
jgi:hypothetical protein